MSGVRVQGVGAQGDDGWRETVVLTLHGQRDGLRGSMMLEGEAEGGPILSDSISAACGFHFVRYIILSLNCMMLQRH